MLTAIHSRALYIITSGQKTIMKRTIIIMLVAVTALLGGATYFFINNSEQVTKSSGLSSSTQTPRPLNKQKYSLSDPDSPWVIVNKNRPISAGYVPVDLVDVAVPKIKNKSQAEYMLRKDSAEQLGYLVGAAKADGIELAIGSGYRSYELQKFYYDNYVAQSGQIEADKFSARPGTSEHQTGLALDLSAIDGKCYLEECFSETPQGKWIAANSYKYGFIVRYPQNKEAITGYQYEPWHVRYVGKELATELNASTLTLEEFFKKY